MGAPNSAPAEQSRNGPWPTSLALLPMGKNDGEQPPQSAVGSRPSGQAAEGRCCSGCVRIRRLIGFRCIFIMLLSVALFVSALFWLLPFLHYADQKDLSLNSSYRGGISPSILKSCEFFFGVRRRGFFCLVGKIDLSIALRICFWFCRSRGLFYVGLGWLCVDDENEGYRSDWDWFIWWIWANFYLEFDEFFMAFFSASPRV